MDFESDLKKEERELVKDKEIQRILECFRLDWYTILETQPGITAADISKVYRKKSLLIHPDKTKNPRAVDAFDLLRKAAKGLEDAKERESLDQAWTDARRELIREKKWTIDDERLTKQQFLTEWRAKVKEVLIDEEMAKRLVQKRDQAAEARRRKREEEVREEKEEQRKEKDKWEGKRGERVKEWRKFSTKMEKKKRKRSKGKVLV